MAETPRPQLPGEVDGVAMDPAQGDQPIVVAASVAAVVEAAYAASSMVANSECEVSDAADVLPAMLAVDPNTSRLPPATSPKRAVGSSNYPPPPVSQSGWRCTGPRALTAPNKKAPLCITPTTQCYRCGANHPDSICRDLHEFLQRQKIPKYGRGLPDVEVTFVVNSLSSLDVRDSAFLADFTLILDWTDPNLKRHTHYTEDLQTQKLQFFPAMIPHIFSPKIILDNSVGIVDPLPGSDSQPLIQAETTRGLWLTQTQRYRGRFSCNTTWYYRFPMDAHGLPISLRSQRWGPHDVPTLCNPKLRHVDRRMLHHQDQFRFRHCIEEEGIHLGDLSFFGFGVRALESEHSSDRRSPDTYEILLIVRRGVFRHVCTCLILSMMTVTGAYSLFCTLSVDGLAGRLSINVTVLLSMVAFTVQRPSAIEPVPYNTLYDNYVHVCTCCTVFSCLFNLLTYITCFEVMEGCDECVDQHLSVCDHVDSVGTTVLDCSFFFGLVCVLVLYWIYLAITIVRDQRKEILGWRAICGDVSIKGEDFSGDDGPLYFQKYRGVLCRPPDSVALRHAQDISSCPSGNQGTLQSVRLKTRQVQPTVSEDDETSFLDMGGGEIGYYTYALARGPFATFAEHMRSFVGPKEEWIGFVDALTSNDSVRLGALRQQLCIYLKSETEKASAQTNLSGTERSPLHSKRKSGSKLLEARRLFIGITGELAAKISESEIVTSQVEEFMAQLEQDWQQESGTVWDVFYFCLTKHNEAFYERVATSWLIDNTDLHLADTFANEPKLKEYLCQQLTSWALLSGKTHLGELERDEFIEKLMPLSQQLTFEGRAAEALEWFRQMDVDNSGTVTVDEMLNFMLQDESLLRSVIRTELFAGTLAGNTNSLQLTVADATAQNDVEVYAAGGLGNKSALSLSIFREDEPVEPRDIDTWESTLLNCFEGNVNSDYVGRISSSTVRTSSAKAVGECVQQRLVRSLCMKSRSNLSDDPAPWPSGLRGIFVGIASTSYAAKECGMGQRLIPKAEAIAHLTTRIGEEYLLEFPPHRERSKHIEQHQQRIANLSMVRCMVSRLLHDDAWLYFRREWTVLGGSSFVATWSLGVFLLGKCSDPAYATIASGRFAKVTSQIMSTSSHSDLGGVPPSTSWMPWLAVAKFLKRRMAPEQTS